MVTVTGFATDTCVICDRETECFEADFGKLKGPLCRACFTRLVRSRSGKKQASRRDEQVSNPNGQQAPAVK
jgi:hypothetical protein